MNLDELFVLPKNRVEVFLSDQNIYYKIGINNRYVKMDRTDDKTVHVNADKLAFVIDTIGDCRIYQDKASVLKPLFLVCAGDTIAAMVMPVQVSESWRFTRWKPGINWRV